MGKELASYPSRADGGDFDVLRFESPGGIRWLVHVEVKKAHTTLLLDETGAVLFGPVDGEPSGTIRDSEGRYAFVQVSAGSLNVCVNYEGKLISRSDWENKVETWKVSSCGEYVIVNAKSPEQKGVLFDQKSDSILTVRGFLQTLPDSFSKLFLVTEEHSGIVTGIVRANGTWVFNSTQSPLCNYGGRIGHGSRSEYPAWLPGEVYFQESDERGEWSNKIAKLTTEGTLTLDAITRDPRLGYRYLANGVFEAFVVWIQYDQQDFETFCAGEPWTEKGKGLIRADGTWIAKPQWVHAWIPAPIEGEVLNHGVFAVTNAEAVFVLNPAGETLLSLPGVEDFEALALDERLVLIVAESKDNHRKAVAVVEAKTKQVILALTDWFDNLYLEADSPAGNGVIVFEVRHDEIQRRGLLVISKSTGQRLFTELYKKVAFCGGRSWICIQETEVGKVMHFTSQLKGGGNEPFKSVPIGAGDVTFHKSLNGDYIGLVCVYHSDADGIYTPDGNRIFNGPCFVEEMGCGRKFWSYGGEFRAGVLSPNANVIAEPKYWGIESNIHSVLHQTAIAHPHLSIATKEVKSYTQPAALLNEWGQILLESETEGLGIAAYFDYVCAHASSAYRWFSPKGNVIFEANLEEFPKQTVEAPLNNPVSVSAAETFKSSDPDLTEPVPQFSEPAATERTSLGPPTPASQHHASSSTPVLSLAAPTPLPVLLHETTSMREPVSPAISKSGKWRARIALALLILIARWSMPGREAHEGAFIDYLEHSFSGDEALKSRITKTTSGISLRNLPADQRRSAINMAGFLYRDYFFISTSECPLANFASVGAASVIRLRNVESEK